MELFLYNKKKGGSMDPNYIACRLHLIETALKGNEPYEAFRLVRMLKEEALKTKPEKKKRKQSKKNQLSEKPKTNKGGK